MRQYFEHRGVVVGGYQIGDITILFWVQEKATGDFGGSTCFHSLRRSIVVLGADVGFVLDALGAFNADRGHAFDVNRKLGPETEGY